MSLWPSISGVALRIRSIRAWTLGSIGWALRQSEPWQHGGGEQERVFECHAAGLGTGTARAIEGLPFVA